jgi:hypothetical protein
VDKPSLNFLIPTIRENIILKGCFMKNATKILVGTLLMTSAGLSFGAVIDGHTSPFASVLNFIETELNGATGTILMLIALGVGMAMSAVTSAFKPLLIGLSIVAVIALAPDLMTALSTNTTLVGE